ncbi:MAG: copper resistance protein NlpE [Dysgonamonadaceae bacterium]|nr:copper resistance protein NlpE [Dysgonamonadaceae bacterium]MDD4729207.1 copper resistance protein NlpE [Dysgonamonadaceae bacterium]
MKNLSKLGVLIALLALTIVSCTNQSSKQSNDNQDAVTTDQTVIDLHTSENSLDWAGVYEGTTPCASCEGIETMVELREDLTYTAGFNYLSGNEDKAHSYTNEGTFTWDTSGQIITLKADDETSQYKVGENHITLLGADGEVNTGELAEFYVLKKKM